MNLHVACQTTFTKDNANGVHLCYTCYPTERTQNLRQAKQTPHGVHCTLGSRDSAVVRALASHQCGPASIPSVELTPHVGCINFVVDSCPCSEGFSQGTQIFLPPQKPIFKNSNLTWKQSMKEPFCGSH